MNKPEIVAKVADRADMTKKATGEFYDALIEVIQEALVSGEEVQLTGLAKFATREKGARIARNPLTGAKVEVPAKIVPYCKISKTLKDSIS